MADAVATKPVPHPGVSFPEFVGLIASLMALNASAIDIMLPALPQIGASLGVADENRRQLVIVVYMLGFGLAQIVYGPLSDRYGRRRVMLPAIVALAVAGVVASLATSFELLLASRFAQGVCAAAARVVTVSIVRDCYGGRQMARVMSLAFIVFLAVPVLAPSIGTLILLIAPWRAIFWSIAVFAAVIALWVGLRMPETLHAEFRRPFNLGTTLAAAKLVVTNRWSLGYILASTLLFGGLMGFINSSEQIFAHTFNAAALFPMMFAISAGAMAVASLFNARVVERVGTRLVSHSALLGLIAATAIHVGVVLAGMETLTSFVVFQSLSMGCFALCTANFNAMAMEPLAAIAGTAASVQGCISTVGGALVGYAIGQSFDGTTLPVALGFLVVGVVTLGVVWVTEGGRLFRPHQVAQVVE